MSFISNLFGGGGSGGGGGVTQPQQQQQQQPLTQPYDFNSFLSNYLNQYVYGQQQQGQPWGQQSFNSPQQNQWQSLYSPNQYPQQQQGGSLLGGVLGKTFTRY